MNKDEIKTREIMIARNGKPLFAVRIDNMDERSDANYVYIENGDIKFSSSWLSSIVPFSVSNESHKIAKEIFTVGLQAAVKTKVMELKQLESILKDINLKECLGTVLVDNTKLLLEVNNNFEKKTQEIVEITEKQMKKAVEEATSKVDKAVEKIEEVAVNGDEIKNIVTDSIVETVKPIAVKKRTKK
jgi:regulator of replication initiation timing